MDELGLAQAGHSSQRIVKSVIDTVGLVACVCLCVCDCAHSCHLVNWIADNETPFFPSFVTVFGQSLGISDVKSYILLKPIMTGSDSQKFHSSLVQKSATKAREDWVSSQGWLFSRWRLDDDVHKSKAHVATLAQSMHLLFSASANKFYSSFRTQLPANINFM